MVDDTPNPDGPAAEPIPTDEWRPTPAPRWVKAFGLTVLILVLLFVVLQLAGVGGQHGPGRHG